MTLMLHEDRELIGLLIKRGLLSPKATRDQMIDLDHRLTSDTFIWQRRCEVAPSDPEFPALIDGMTEAVESLTPAELADLKERIGIVVPFKNKAKENCK